MLQAVEQARFLPFGEQRPWSGAPSSAPWLDRGFTGHLHNDEVGLIYMNARYYVPSLGRFASADTIVPNAADPQQFNRFSYVLNNPLNLIDPTGHSCESPESSDEHVACEAQKETENQILSSTVRFRMTGILRVGGKKITLTSRVSHGTVKDGQYIVTHNHFDLLNYEAGGEYVRITEIELFDHSGNSVGIWKNLPLPQRFSDSPETLMFDFGANALANAGFSSAIFESTRPKVGDQVAQISWDSSTNSTSISWTAITEISETSTPIIKTSNSLQTGSSGGGIFWNGKHIANNWSTTSSESTGALNSLTVTR